MRKRILSQNKREERVLMNKAWRYSISALLIVAISGVLVLRSNMFKMDKPIMDKNQENKIVLNEIDSLGVTSADADVQVKDISLDYTNILKDLAVPKDLDNGKSYSLYTRKDKSSKYDILNCVVNNYFSEDYKRDIRVAFSKENKPLRDYHFSDEGAKKSKVLDREMVFYRYEDIYFVEFVYEEFNFDIEASGIDLKELVTFIESIIKS